MRRRFLPPIVAAAVVTLSGLAAVTHAASGLTPGPIRYHDADDLIGEADIDVTWFQDGNPYSNNLMKGQIGQPFHAENGFRTGQRKDNIRWGVMAKSGTPFVYAQDDVLSFDPAQASLPPGLKMDPATGAIDGTPRRSGFTTIWIVAYLTDRATKRGDAGGPGAFLAILDERDISIANEQGIHPPDPYLANAVLPPPDPDCANEPAGLSGQQNRTTPVLRTPSVVAKPPPLDECDREKLGVPRVMGMQRTGGSTAVIAVSGIPAGWRLRVMGSGSRMGLKRPTSGRLLATVKPAARDRSAGAVKVKLTRTTRFVRAFWTRTGEKPIAGPIARVR